MKKTILCISNHGDMLGGGEHSFLDLLGHLPPPWNPVAAVPSNGELARLLEEAGIQTHVIPLSAIRPWFSSKILQTKKKIVNFCKKIQPALIYANGSRAALYGGIVGRTLKLPVIWHCRIADTDSYLDYLLTKLSNRIVVNSQVTADRFGSRAKPKVRLVYNGIDLDWLKHRNVKKPALIQDEWKVLLVVARVSRLKRHDVVLSAFEYIAKSEPMVHLICLGSRDASEAEWWDHLQERTRHSPFSSRIHWVGQVEDVLPWYRSAHMSILGSENEAFGRVLIEAMACGVPVVATRSGGIPEIVRHGQDGFLVAPGEVKEMAEAIAKILKEESLREHLVSSAHERANFFSLESHVAKMVQIFENTLPKQF